MDIIVKNRKDAAAFCRKPHSLRSLIISIRDPDANHSKWDLPIITADNGVQAILPLYFEDTDNDTSMSEKDAEAIAQFVLQKADTCDLLIVHCEAGMSRSAGTAAALMCWFNGDDSPIFDHAFYRPNTHCYRAVLNALSISNGGVEA